MISVRRIAGLVLNVYDYKPTAAAIARAIAIHYSECVESSDIVKVEPTNNIERRFVLELAKMPEDFFFDFTHWKYSDKIKNLRRILNGYSPQKSGG